VSAHLRLELAAVDDTTDPLSLGRIKVKYVDGLISGWLQVASPFAGTQSGMFSLPETDTPALVAFATEDRTCGYIIGFLWTGTSKPPIAENAQQKQVWLLKDGSGNSLKIDASANPNVISLESTGDLLIKAAGKVTIKGDTIDMSKP
jgi:uncharacterized protein involved in type VI secretion and phage assembly